MSVTVFAKKCIGWGRGNVPHVTKFIRTFCPTFSLAPPPLQNSEYNKACHYLQAKAQNEAQIGVMLIGVSMTFLVLIIPFLVVMSMRYSVDIRRTARVFADFSLLTMSATQCILTNRFASLSQDLYFNEHVSIHARRPMSLTGYLLSLICTIFM